MPADEIIKGDSTFTEQPITRITKPGEPVRTKHTFIGPQVGADSFEEYLLNNYNALNLTTQKGTPCVIEFETTDEGLAGEDPSLRVLTEVSWSLEWERELKDIRGHGYFYMSGTSYEIMERIDAAIKKGNARLTDWDAVAAYGHMNDYMKCRLLGINSFILYAPVIRATLTMGRYTNLRVPSASVGKVVAWSDIKLPFPAGEAMTPSVGGIDQPKIHEAIMGGTFQDTLVNEWLVSPIKRDYTRNPQRYNMSFEWLGATAWTKALYDGGTGYPPS